MSPGTYLLWLVCCEDRPATGKVGCQVQSSLIVCDSEPLLMKLLSQRHARSLRLPGLPFKDMGGRVRFHEF